MAIINRLITGVGAGRLRAIERFCNHPFQVQTEQLASLLDDKNSYLGSMGDVRTAEELARKLPIVDYEAISPHIDQVRAGNTSALWAGSPTLWAAKSSGTTASASKYIPITRRYLDRCHYRGGRDVMTIFANNFPDSRAFTGKALTLGGSAVLEHVGGLRVGDLSAILIENTPSWVSLLREPRAKIALIADFEQKVEAICRSTINKNITSFAGVPSWNLVLMNKILDFTGKTHINEVWPNMSLFIHGGVAFTPYRTQYEAIIPSADMRYMETYNASEGFFALQNDPRDSSMLLMLDYDIFYEFIPLATLDDHSTAVPLEGVRTGVNYAMLITTSGGLWRYMIGDTVEFTSLAPHKIRITGRTKHFINAFGEEIIIDNAEKALSEACRATNASIADYTAAPIFMEGKTKGAHQWLIEFSTAPTDNDLFTEILDKTLCEVNSDYAAKRHANTTLTIPHLSIAPPRTFHRWMEKRGKVGGQNKVPRLANDRRYIDDLMSIIEK